MFVMVDYVREMTEEVLKVGQTGSYEHLLLFYFALFLLSFFFYFIQTQTLFSVYIPGQLPLFPVF